MTDRERAEQAYNDWEYRDIPRTQKDVFIEAFILGMAAADAKEWERIRETRDKALKKYYGD